MVDLDKRNNKSPDKGPGRVGYRISIERKYEVSSYRESVLWEVIFKKVGVLKYQLSLA